MNLLNLLCAFDLVTPAAAFVQDAIKGPAFNFAVPDNAGWNRPALRRLLERHGIQGWGFMFSGDHVLFTTREADAPKAWRLLRESGVPMLNCKPKGK